MEQTITVIPIANRWAIKCPAHKSKALFRNGAAAEAAARSLADEIAEAGVTAVIEIYLRDGTLGGRYVHAPKARGWTAEVSALGRAVPGSPAAR